LSILNSCKDISLSVKDLYVSLANERRKNHGIHDRKTKYRHYETEREHKNTECEEMGVVLFAKMLQTFRVVFEEAYNAHF